MICFKFAAIRSARLLAGFAALALCLAGCGRKDAISLASTHEKEFQSATGDIKAGWEAVAAAAKAHDYAAALTATAKIANNPALTPEQKKALTETATAISDEMYERANKADAAALKALQELRKANGR